MIIAFVSNEGNQHFPALKLLSRVNSVNSQKGNISFNSEISRQNLLTAPQITAAAQNPSLIFQFFCPDDTLQSKDVAYT